MNLNEASNADELAKLLADDVAEKLAAGIAKNGKASLAVSGGSTPMAFFQYLSIKPLEWDKVVVTLADERWVPFEHDDSNERLVHENLLQDNAKAATFCSLVDMTAATAEAGLAVVAKRVKEQLPMPFTVLILGMGGDGHTASLFPDTEGLDQAMDLNNPEALQIMRPAVSPHARITFTRSALLNSDNRYLHITGAGKKALLDTIATPEGDKLPIARFLDKPPIAVYWSP